MALHVKYCNIIDLKKEELPECTNINPYYPFENIDILKQLVDTIFTFYGNIERIKPRLWYNIMSKILEQAVLRGYIPLINLDMKNYWIM